MRRKYCTSRLLCFSAIERLERRELLAADLAALIGRRILAPTPTELDTPVDGLFHSGGFELIGADQSIAATQFYPMGGTRHDIVYFDSLLSAQGNGGSQKGAIGAGVLLPNGDVLYTGESAGSFDSDQPTFWLAPSLPQGGVNSVGQERAGAFVSVSADGTLVGTADGAVYATTETLPQDLPGLNVAGAVDISADSQYIVGDLIWSANMLGGYDVVDTSGFDFTVSGPVGLWHGVEVDVAGEVFFAGEYFDVAALENRVGFWNGSGTYLGSWGNQFADFELMGGEVIAAVNTLDDALLVQPVDGQTLSISALTGSAAQFPHKGLFAAGTQTGLLLENASGPFVTLFQQSTWDEQPHDFGELFTSNSIAPTLTDLDNATDGVFHDGGFELVGSDNDIAAAQYYLPSGQRRDLRYFESFLSAEGRGGDPQGRIFDATQLANGQVLYVGDSAGVQSIQQPTYWFSPSQPQGGVGSLGQQVDGFYLAVSEDELFVGSGSISGQYATPGHLPTDLGAAGFPVDITTNSQYMVGTSGLIWRANTLDGYDVVSTSGFDFSVSGGVPDWQNAEVDGSGEVYFVGEYFDLTTFETFTGYWDAAGNFLGSYAGTAADTALVDGELVTGLNRNGQGYLVRPRDGALIAVGDLITLSEPASVRGLFATAGQLGLVLENSSGIYTSVLTTAAFSPPHEDLVLFDPGTGRWKLGVSDGLTFTWTNGPKWNPAAGWTTFTGDYNGDGLTDGIGINNQNAVFFARNNGDGTMTTVSGGSFSALESFQHLMVGDFNGDGRTDFIVQQSTNNTTPLPGSWFVKSFNGTAFTTSFYGRWEAAGWIGFGVGDVNLDGVDDIIGLRNAEGVIDRVNWLYGISNVIPDASRRFYAQFAGAFNGRQESQGWVPVVGDWDGDGRTDVAARRNDGRFIYGTATGSPTAYAAIGANRLINSTGPLFSPSAFTGPFLVGDFNGDGRDDLLTRQSNNKNLWGALTNAAAPTSATVSAWGAWDDTKNWSGAAVGDFNGDGLDDYASVDLTTSHAWVSLSTGSAFLSATDFGLIPGPETLVGPLRLWRGIVS